MAAWNHVPLTQAMHSYELGCGGRCGDQPVPDLRCFCHQGCDQPVLKASECDMVAERNALLKQRAFNLTVKSCQMNMPNKNFESRLGTQWEFIRCRCLQRNNNFQTFIYTVTSNFFFLQTLPKVCPIYCIMVMIFNFYQNISSIFV